MTECLESLLHTIVGLPQPKALEPEDFARTRTLAIARSLVIAEENYETYYRRAAATYKARSPIGEPPLLDKLVWVWSPYRKLGTSGALSSKWSGPWKIVKFSPPALLVIQTTWLTITGRRELCRKIVIDKLKLFKHAPDNIGDCQPRTDQIKEGF